MNLFAPYQIMAELNKENENLLQNANLKTPIKRIHVICGWWWGLWIASRISGYGGRLSENPELLTTGMIMDMVNSVLTIGAGVLAVYVIKNYHEMEVELKNLEDVSQVNPDHPELLDSM
ncbi:MAG: hypothetical protein DCO96_13165 [Fluviicola sp. XM-24bin1]|nr:MAG: hypothetical protein DCO96_13165 [Fluviicola sp. XM-24bin1]